MSTNKLYDSSLNDVPPAMQMWEWFDVWAQYVEWSDDRGNVLAEADAAPDEDEAAQHNFYMQHFKDVLTNHTKMSRDDRRARMKDVLAYAKKHGIPEKEAMRIRSGGHDIKSMRSGFALINAALNSPHGDKLSQAARAAREDRKAPGGREENAAEVAATLMTRHGHAQSEESPLRLGMIHRRLAAREKFMDENPKADVGGYHEHSLARIADDTGATEDEVRSLAKSRKFGVDVSPIRNLAKQAMDFVAGGGKLTHDWVAKAGARLVKQRQRSLEAAGSKEAKLKKAVSAGGAQPTGGEEGESALGNVPAPIPGQSRTALRVAKSVRSPGNLLHHPGSSAAKGGAPNLGSTEEHETLAKSLGLDPKATIQVGQAIKKLYRKGESAKNIAAALKLPLANVEGAILGRRSGPAQAGGGSSISNPTLERAIASEKKKIRSAAEAAGLSPSKALSADLHDLYPLREPAKEGETEAEKEKRNSDFAKKIKEMYFGNPEKGIMPKPHLKTIDPRSDVRFKGKGPGGENVKPESVGLWGSPQTAFAGFKGGGKGALDHPGDLPEGATEAQKKKHKEALDKFHDFLATAHEGVHKAMQPVLSALADRKHPENVMHAKHTDALRRAELAGATSRVAELEKKNIHPDLVQHHLNLAADRPEVRTALGIPAEGKASHGHTRSALGNIFNRIEEHGKNYMKSAQLYGGLGQQKARQAPETSPLRRRQQLPGDPFSRARVRVPSEVSGAGGEIGTPEHKPEHYYSSPPGGSMSQRVLDARARSERSARAQSATASQTREEKRLARIRAAKQPSIVTGRQGPARPSEAEREEKARQQADLRAAARAQKLKLEPGKAGGRAPRGIPHEKLLRVRPTTPGTGSTITRPTTGHEPPAETGREKFERLFGQKSSKPGVAIQRAGGGRAAPLKDVKITKREPGEAPAHEESVNLRRSSLVLSEGKSLLERIAELD